MVDLKAFRKVNSITQVDLAAYLEVGQGFISQIEKGSRPLPKEYMSRLLANPYGWDTSMLLKEKSSQETSAPEQAAPNNSLIEYLQRKIAELESKVDKLTDEKAELLQENAILKYENTMLSPRKGDVEDAGSSSSASAV